MVNSRTMHWRNGAQDLPGRYGCFTKVNIIRCSNFNIVSKTFPAECILTFVCEIDEKKMILSLMTKGNHNRPSILYQWQHG